MKWNRRFWSLEFGDIFWIQFNWADNGWNLGIDYDSDGYTRSIELSLIKPSISFGYTNKSTRESFKK